MSYSMTHLIIAKEYLRNNPVENPGLFLLANISPDCVHARNNFDKAMKERSHYLQKGTEWGTIFEEEPMKIWYDSLRSFYFEHSNRIKISGDRFSTACSDFLDGYAMHILVDIFNCRLLYAPVRKKYGSDLEIFRKEYRNQCLIWDYHLYRSYYGTDDIFAEIKNGLADLPDSLDHILEENGLNTVINAEDVKNNLAYNIDMYGKNMQEKLKDGAYMITEETSDYFISHVGEQCERLLYDFPEAGRLFKE